MLWKIKWPTIIAISFERFKNFFLLKKKKKKRKITTKEEKRSTFVRNIRSRNIDARTLYRPRTSFLENENSFFRESDLFSRVSREFAHREIVIIRRVYIDCKTKEYSRVNRASVGQLCFNLTNANRHCSRFKYVIHRFVIN